MKILAKTKAKLIETKAESMAEVVVAFLILSLVMALFAQGLRYATSAEAYAKDNTVACDKSMIELQKTLAGKGGTAYIHDEPDNVALSSMNNALKLSCYSVTTDYDTNIYWVFDAGNATDSGD